MRNLRRKWNDALPLTFFAHFHQLINCTRANSSQTIRNRNLLLVQLSSLAFILLKLNVSLLLLLLLRNSCDQSFEFIFENNISNYLEQIQLSKWLFLLLDSWLSFVNLVLLRRRRRLKVTREKSPKNHLKMELEQHSNRLGPATHSMPNSKSNKSQIANFKKH